MELNGLRWEIAAVRLNAMIKKRTCSTRGTRQVNTISTSNLLMDPALRPAAEFPVETYMGCRVPTGTASWGEATAAVSACTLYSSGRSSKYSVVQADWFAIVSSTHVRRDCSHNSIRTSRTIELLETWIYKPTRFLHFPCR